MSLCRARCYGWAGPATGDWTKGCSAFGLKPALEKTVRFGVALFPSRLIAEFGCRRRGKLKTDWPATP